MERSRVKDCFCRESVEERVYKRGGEEIKKQGSLLHLRARRKSSGVRCRRAFTTEAGFGDRSNELKGAR